MLAAGRGGYLLQDLLGELPGLLVVAAEKIGFRQVFQEGQVAGAATIATVQNDNFFLCKRTICRIFII